MDPGSGSVTHRVLCRGTDEQRVEALNRVAGAVAERGDAARLSLRGRTSVGNLSPHTQRLLDERFERVPDDEVRNGSGDPEFRVDLPDGADALVDALTVEESESPDNWGAAGENHWRVYEVGELFVVRNGECLYRSVPHHSQQYLNADVDPDAPARANEALVGTPSVVVPEDPLVEWDEYAISCYEFRAPEQSPGLDNLRRVYVDDARADLVFDWTTPSERVEASESRVARALGKATLGLFSLVDDPDAMPERISVDDRETFDAAVEALAEANERGEHEFDIVRS